MISYSHNQSRRKPNLFGFLNAIISTFTFKFQVTYQTRESLKNDAIGVFWTTFRRDVGYPNETLLQV